jgi:hypothetical protein
METQALTAFFMWCTIINGGLLIFSTLVMMIMPDFVYKVQSRWFPVSRQTFDVVIYCFLGLFKVLFIVFNIAPYVALLIIG